MVAKSSPPPSSPPSWWTSTEIARTNVTFDYTTGGTSTQYVTSSFNRQMPVTVTHTYELNGQQLAPSRASSLSSKGGGLLVSYGPAANVAKQTTTAHYRNFNRARQSPPDPSLID